MINDTRTLKNKYSKISIVNAEKTILFKHKVISCNWSPISRKFKKVIEYDIRDYGVGLSDTRY